jgi:hypothetical protein
LHVSEELLVVILTLLEYIVVGDQPACVDRAILCTEHCSDAAVASLDSFVAYSTSVFLQKVSKETGGVGETEEVLHWNPGNDG